MANSSVNLGEFEKMKADFYAWYDIAYDEHPEWLSKDYDGKISKSRTAREWMKKNICQYGYTNKFQAKYKYNNVYIQERTTCFVKCDVFFVDMNIKCKIRVLPNGDEFINLNISNDTRGTPTELVIDEIMDNYLI